VRHYCTYFDGNYAPQGLAMLHSLRRHDPGAEVLVWALDAGALAAVERHAPPGVTVELHPTAGAENIWRLTPGLVLAAMDRWPEVAYVDADIYWFASPQPLYDEAGDATAAIIPHRWAPEHAARLRPNGVYNVGWVWFNGDVAADLAMVWQWQCDHWRPAGDWRRFMDQPFLDLWPHFGAHVIQHLGANLAPYNQARYNGYTDTDGVRCVEDPLDDLSIGAILFYHFHEWRWWMVAERECRFARGGYPLQPWVVRECYEPYEDKMGAWICHLVTSGTLTPENCARCRPTPTA